MREEFTKESIQRDTPPIEPKIASQVAPRIAAREAQGELRESRFPLSTLRKVIAQRLVASQREMAVLTTFNEIDLSELSKLREAEKEAFLKKHGSKLGWVSFFTKATVAALQEVPQLNAFLQGDEIIQRHYCDIGIAVGTDRGLVVPVLRGCETLKFFEIERAINDFAQRARKGTLSLQELQGAGFTITNGGVYGSLLSTPLLVAPQCGILGMHKIEKRPVVIDDTICIRPMMYVALSYDHRIVDGKEAVSFLVSLKRSLENPARFFLED
jgi:2-oxoglutarate dehydrogenase E2 component (dihydrolipoamide succinyltransferase)